MISVGRNEKVIGGAKNRIELENVYFGNPVYGLNTNIGLVVARRNWNAKPVMSDNRRE